MLIIKEFPEAYNRGSKRTNLVHHDLRDGDEGPQTWDWFVGYGKDGSCDFEGTWWDMICFARNILASKNTELVAREFYKPEWQNNNYTGEEKPYQFERQTP